MCTGIRAGCVDVGVGGKGTGLIYQLMPLIITKQLLATYGRTPPNVSLI